MMLTTWNIISKNPQKICHIKNTNLCNEKKRAKPSTPRYINQVTFTRLNYFFYLDQFNLEFEFSIVCEKLNVRSFILTSGNKSWMISRNQLVSLALQIVPWLLSLKGLLRMSKLNILFEKHIGNNELSLWTTILKTRHLVEELSKQPCVGKLSHYQ